MDIVTTPHDILVGEIALPGDKSISHRALLLASVAVGVTHIDGLLASEDTRATLDALRVLGISVETDDLHGIRIQGQQKFVQPTIPLDLKNSGTGLRLLAGLLAGQNLTVSLTGDDSLQKRPMARIVEPLQEMGAQIEMTSVGTAPLHIFPASSLHAIEYCLPIASAQLKSALLLAGLFAKGTTVLHEAALSRDHTERMLPLFSGEIHRSGHEIHLPGMQLLKSTEIKIPGDLSSAAFFIVAASIATSAQIVLRGVGVNPTRTGVIDLLRQMGANIIIENQRYYGLEPVADIHIQSAKLRGIDIPVAQIPLAIDEFPVLFIAAACATGVTILRKAEELRFKESDRLAAMAHGLRTLGITVEEFPDGIAIHGGLLQGGIVDSMGDHRVAMAFAVAGIVAKDRVLIRNCANIATSFPAFVSQFMRLGIKLKTVQEVNYDNKSESHW